MQHLQTIRWEGTHCTHLAQDKALARLFQIESHDSVRVVRNIRSWILRGLGNKNDYASEGQ
jgi:hypothetical protein